MHSNEHHSAPAQLNPEITSVRVPEGDAIKVIAKDSIVTIFGDGRIEIDSPLPLDIFANKLTITSEEAGAETYSS